MTAQLLVSELSALVQESKRKNPELKSFAEKSLSDLKALPSTSETQLSADLRRRPHLLKPFLLACTSRNPKFAGSAIVCLQRIVVSNGLPKESLKDVLEAFRECSSLGLDIQLKVLQALPSLLQNYANSLTGDLLGAAFQVCFLLHNSKTAVVSNTAAASLQQLVYSTFEKVATEDGHSFEGNGVAEVPSTNGTLSIRGAALDAYHVLTDVCLLTEGQKPEFLQTASLSQNFGLDLVESVLANHADTVMSHLEQIDVLRLRLMPFIIKILSEKAPFTTTVRAMRLLHLVLSRLLFALASECEMALSLLNHMLDLDAAALWKRALCLEIFRGIHADPTLVRSIYAHYDEQDEKRNIIRDHLATLVRLASEKPAMIGLGQQSTIPASTSQTNDSSSEQVAMQAGGVASTIGAAVSSNEANAPGISTRWSTIKTPCIEVLDKSEAPTLPATYIYSLALTCINNFSEGLARFLLPFTVPTDTRLRKKQQRVSKEVEESNENTTSAKDDKKQIRRAQSFRERRSPVNPLTLDSHVLYSQICTSAHMVDNCWPALLAACSTYLNAALDSDFYHALIRAFQKFTQVAGLLGLSTPRDAFLTTLGKHAVPSVSVNTYALSSSNSPKVNGWDRSSRVDNPTESDRDTSPSPSVSSDKGRQVTDASITMLSTRNLLCLRALLNLAIALGPTLHKSWFIVFETLQQADLIISHSVLGRRHAQVPEIQTTSDDADSAGDYVLEITAVETAASRMFESTSELTDEAFMDALTSLCSLLRNAQDDSNESSRSNIDKSLTPQSALRKHQRSTSSMLNTSMSGAAVVRGNNFVLEKLGHVIKCNISRLLQDETAETGWELLVGVVISVLGSQSAGLEIRIKAANTLNTMVVAIAVSQESLTPDEQDLVRKRCFAVIRREIAALYNQRGSDTKLSQECELEIHRLSLEALRSILEQCGDSLKRGWNQIFAIITSIFDGSKNTDNNDSNSKPGSQGSSAKLVRSSFGSLQLICSDFLSSVPRSCLPVLLDALYSFCSQDQDLNISLTTTTFFRNVSEFLQSDNGNLDINDRSAEFQEDLKLIRSPKNQSLEVSTSALWLCLLLRTSLTTTDSRLEVRHSALHTMFGIFDSCGDRLSAAGWQTCFKIIVLPMLSANETKFQEVRSSVTSGQPNEQRSWSNTAIVMIDGVSRLLAHSLDVMRRDNDFPDMWGKLLGYLNGLLDRKVLDVSTMVFTAMTRILVEIEDAGKVPKSVTNHAWILWKEGSPVLHDDSLKGKGDNQDALVAYLQCLRHLYRLLEADFQLEKSKMVIERIHSCASHSTIQAYSADVDYLTPLQTQVLDSLKMIRTDIGGVLPELIDSMAKFITMAYEEKTKSPDRKSPTYVALSKSTMDLLVQYVGKHVTNVEMYSSGSLTRALSALTIPLDLKYKWHTEGKTPTTWQKATKTATIICNTCVPVLKNLKVQELDVPLFWEKLVKVSSGIMTADFEACTSPADIPRDQNFDIEAFSSILHLITPGMGSPTIPDVIRRKYAESVFKNSIIHAPHPDDLAKPGQEPLEGLRSSHIGRTQDLPPTPRSRMSYTLLDELFSLVTVHDGSSERIKLAQAAAPYLILRAGITLKAYILDQPLRGRMPQPLSQKKEMVYVLRKLVELDSEPKAIPDALGVNSRHKKHLHRLYPLVMQSLEVAWRDTEMTEALRTVLEAVGQDFGV